MKRVLAALAALCLLASGVSAKGLVIIASTSGNNANFANGIRPMENQWLSTLRGLGADFDVIRSDQLTAPAASFNATIDAYLRHGKVWKNGIGVYSATGDSIITTYNPVIHLGYSSSDANMTSPAGRYRADSLTLACYYPTVTHLFVANMNHTNNCFNTVANRCSLGTTTVASAAAITYNARQDSTLNVYEVGNPSRTWKSVIGFQVNATRTPKGWRPILATVTTRQEAVGGGTNNYDFPDPNSFDLINGGACAYRTNPDTVALWSILNRDPTGVAIGGNAKPMFFCGATRVSNATDFDMGIVLTAIALVDSASGGGLLGGSTKVPALLGIHIDDGWKRGDSNGGEVGGGIAWTDTTALKATIDSLAALAVPFVVGVEVDSLSEYANYDGKWWGRAPMAHFTPHCHSGVGGPSAGFAPKTQNVGTKYLNLIDQWGISRTRYAFGSVDSALAYSMTDYVNDVADSAATYWLTKRAFALLDSTFGSGRVDHLVMPPGDDWTNSQIKHSTSTGVNAVDSVIAAARLAGATGIRMNAYSAFSAVIQSPNETNNYGYYINPQVSSVHGTGSPAWVPVARYGDPCNLLACFGYPTTSTTDKSLPHASGTSWSRHVRRNPGDYSNSLRGIFGGPFDESVWAGSATMGQNIRANIHALHVGDLGSRQPATGGELTRPGFYNLKYLVNSVKMANAHALKPLVQFAYPDGMQP